MLWEREKRVWAQYGDHQIHSLLKMNCNLYFASHIKQNAAGEVPWQSPLLRKLKLCNTSSQTFPRVPRPGLGSSQSHLFIHSLVSASSFPPRCPALSPLPPAASSRGGDEDEEEGDEGKTQADPKKGEKGKRRRGKKKGGKEGEKEETILSKVIGFLN